MPEILKLPGLFLLLAVLLISSLCIDAVSGDSEQGSFGEDPTDGNESIIDTNESILEDESIDLAIVDDDLIDSDIKIDIERIIDPTIIRDAGNVAYMGSFDKRTVSSYSNESMTLGNSMRNAFEMAEDGISKTRKTTMISCGSDLLQIEEISNLAGYDTSGNKFSANYGRSTTLKNFDFPFAIIRNDEIAISGEDLSIKKTQSETTLVFPDWINPDSLDKIKSALGNPTDINEVPYNLTGGANPEDLTGSILQSFEKAGIDTDALLSITMDTKFWDILHQAALEAQKQQNNPKPPIADEWNADEFSLTSGGIECIWGYKI